MELEQLLGQLHPAGNTDRISCSEHAMDVLGYETGARTRPPRA